MVDNGFGILGSNTGATDNSVDNTDGNGWYLVVQKCLLLVLINDDSSLLQFNGYLIVYESWTMISGK